MSWTIVKKYLKIYTSLSVYLILNRHFVCYSLWYGYLIFKFVGSNVDIDTTLYPLMQSFIEQYTVNMDPVHTGVAESSAMGAAASQGSMPPPPPPEMDPAILTSVAGSSLSLSEDDLLRRGDADHWASEEENRQIERKVHYNETVQARRSQEGNANPFSSEWRANEVHKTPYGWVNENGREICPATKKAILSNGYCTEHETRVCESPAGGDPDPNLNIHVPGRVIAGRFMWETRRQQVIKYNMNYNRHYKAIYNKINDYSPINVHNNKIETAPWSTQNECDIATFYNTATFFAKKNKILKIKDLGLSASQTQHLRNLILNDKGATTRELSRFLHHNVSEVQVVGRVKKHLDIILRTYMRK